MTSKQRIRMVGAGRVAPFTDATDEVQDTTALEIVLAPATDGKAPS